MKLAPCKLKNRNSVYIKGVVIEPEEAVTPAKTGVMYLPGITLGSTAVHRLGFQIGDLLSSKGFITCIFDQSGIGESEGDIPDGTHRDHVKYVKEGKLTGDSVEAIDLFVKKYGLEGVVLAGHCGGAMTGTYAAGLSPHVKGLILISAPIGTDEAQEKNKTADEYARLYKNKIFSISAWKNLLSGNTDYKMLLDVIRDKLFGGSKREQMNAGGKFDPKFIDSFISVRDKIKIYSIMGDKDPGVEEYKTFAAEFLKGDEESIMLDDSSHGFVTQESMDKLFNEIEAFMKGFN